MPKIVWVSKKVRIFATAKPKGGQVLGYGVMVTLQILVLSFLVRIQVAQLKIPIRTYVSDGDFSYFLFRYGLPHVRSPHHFAAQCVEERMVVALYHLDGIVGTRDGEAGRFVACLAASVYGDEEVMVAALNVERDGPIVTDDDRSHVEAMGGDGSNGDGFAMGHDDGAAHAERVSGGAGRRGDDETIGLVSGER